ncbi:MAG: ADOP family duplicated permease [Terriglobales bacterium]
MTGWLGRLWRRRRLEVDLERELAFHLETDASLRQAGGATAGEARRQARLRLGSVEAAREACRDARGTRWVEDLARDTRQALRLWRRRPGFAAAVVVTLALGIGVSTLMVSLVAGVLLRPLNFAHPAQLVTVQEQTAGPPSAAAVAEGWGRFWAGAYPNYEDLRRASRTLELGAWANNGDLLSGPGPAAYVEADDVSASLFPLLGVAPVAGRGFLPQEDQPGGAPVAMVSAELARGRWGSTQAALGAGITFAGKRWRVVGVMPAGFDVTGIPGADSAQLFLPIGQEAPALLQNRQRHWINMVGRLRPGAGLPAAERELEVIARRLQARYPQSNAERGFAVRPLRPDVGDAGATLWVLLAAAGLVLLLACANVACLLLTHALGRERELEMRRALGASRGRLVRQELTGSLLYGLGGGALGVALARAGLRPFLAWWPGGLPRAGAVTLDGRVLAFAAAAALLGGLLLGLVPAWFGAGVRLGRPLAAARVHSGWGQRVLVAAQMALALVLLAGAGLLGRAVVRLSALDLGVNTSNVLTARVMLPATELSNPARAHAAWNEMRRRLRAIPGVTAAAIVDTVPLRQGNDVIPYWTGATKPPDAAQPNALATTVSPQYFQTMGIRRLRGRVIDARDLPSAVPVAVIDDRLAHDAFGQHNPIGQPIHLGLGNDPLTVVGVVQHVRYWGPAGDVASPVQDEVYYALNQLPDRLMPRWSQLMSIAVRTAVPPGGLLPQIQHAVAGPGGGQAMYEVRTMSELARGKLAQQRFLLLLFSIFGGLALLLAALGVYGVQSWLAARRQPELAVRLALGAGRGSVFGMMLRQNLGTLVAGAAAGLAGAVAAARLLGHAVPGVGAGSAVAPAAAAVVLIAAAVAASVPVARRSSRTDPAALLRQP